MSDLLLGRVEYDRRLCLELPLKTNVSDPL